MSKRIAAFLATTITFFSSFINIYAAETKESSLRGTFADYFIVGNIMNSIQTKNSEITDMFKHHYGIVTAEYNMKPEFLSPSKGVYDFSNADKIVSWAEQNGIKVHGHTLVWHNQSAEWLTSNNGSLVTRDEAKANLENYIKNVAGHYKGKVISWDVVNEAIGDDVYVRGTEWKDGLRINDSPLYNAYANGANAAKGESGADYIYDAFVFARLADPGAKLYYNDYNEISASKSTIIVNMVNSLNELWKNDSRNTDKNRLLIEGIGMQSHYSIKEENLAEKVEATLKKYISTGADIAISELDISIGYSANGNEADYTKQAELYKDLFELYIKYSDNISRVIFWGKADDESWSQTKPLPFGKGYVPKQAYYSIINAIPKADDTDSAEHVNSVGTLKVKSVKLTSEDKAIDNALSKIDKENNGIVISFDNWISSKTSIKVNVSDLLGKKSGIKKSQTCYIYKFNSKTGKFEETIQNKVKVNSDGTISVNNVENAKYVILTTEINNKNITPLTAQVSASVPKSALKKGNSAMINIKSPQGLNIVKTLDKNSKEPQVKISYHSSDSKIATVDSSGKLNFKKKGKVVIMLKYEFSNGKTKNSKLNLIIN